MQFTDRLSNTDGAIQFLFKPFAEDPGWMLLLLRPVGDHDYYTRIRRPAFNLTVGRPGPAWAATII